MARDFRAKYVFTLIHQVATAKGYVTEIDEFHSDIRPIGPIIFFSKTVHSPYVNFWMELWHTDNKLLLFTLQDIFAG